MKKKLEKLFFFYQKVHIGFGPIVKQELARKNSPIPCHPRTGKRVVQSRSTFNIMGAGDKILFSSSSFLLNFLFNSITGYFQCDLEIISFITSN